MNSLEIVEYSPELKRYFYDINQEWVSKMFIMEEIDEAVLGNPDKFIISNGGYIWFVSHPDFGIVGTCALMKVSQTDYELTKMGVFQKARGLKAGEFLLKHVINFVRENRIPKCFLLTNKDCEAAIHLYLKNGFEHSEEIMSTYGKRYDRCNVSMLLKI